MQDDSGELVPRKGVISMSVYEALSLMIAFATLIVLIMNGK